MTRDDALEMARGWTRKYEAFDPSGRGTLNCPTPDHVRRLEADLADMIMGVAFRERDACAEECERYAATREDETMRGVAQAGIAARHCANRIRARGEKGT